MSGRPRVVQEACDALLLDDEQTRFQCHPVRGERLFPQCRSPLDGDAVPCDLLAPR
jgi:hypothetical protein